MEEGTGPRKRRAVGSLILLLAGAAALSGCLGPTTPLGAVDRWRGEDGAPVAGADAPAEAAEKAQIRFFPSVQRVHGPYTWQVAVVDPHAADRPDARRLRVFYNGLEVTASARFQFRVAYRLAGAGEREALLLEMPHLRLPPLDDHEIVVEYTPARGLPLAARYHFPAVRDLEAEEALAGTEPFSVSPRVLEAVFEASRHYRLNPVLLAALIAQESSFNPHAVSKARAIGLTQITHLAERDIAAAFPHWPRYRGIERLSRSRLRALIPQVVHGGNEWRLDPVKSVWGGAHYLAYLRTRLTHERNRPKLGLGGEDEDRILAEACLAAYNSGLTRTLSWLSRHGGQWLDQGDAREARRYVRKILSFYGAFREEPAPPAWGGPT